jgi:hypothetical protein
MSLLVFAMWMRSYVVLDGMLIPDRQFQYDIVSMNGGVKWERCDPVPVANRLVETEWISGAVTIAHRADYWSTLSVEWRWKCCGFDFGAAMDAPSNVRFEFAVVPYWSLVLLLSLLSAYLIVWKPRKRTVP